MWSYIDQYGRTVLTFISSVILARLLVPAEVGIYSLSLVFIGYANFFRDFGVGEYLIQEKSLTPNKIQTAFTCNFISGASLCLIILALAQPIADLYDTPELAHVFWVLALHYYVST